MVWTEFGWPITGSSGRLRDNGNEPLGSRKGGEFLEF